MNKCKYQGRDVGLGCVEYECEAYAENIGCEYQEFDYNPDGRINIVMCGLVGERIEEEILIDALRKIHNKDIQALLLHTYILVHGALSDANGEIVRQILMEGTEE